MESFTKFGHEGWQRVADKYDSVWGSSTRQFIPPLLDALEVLGGMSVPDLGCGHGCVLAAAAACGANPRGLDFSKEVIGTAHRMSGNRISGRDAQHLPSFKLSFDRVLANFTLLHRSRAHPR